MKEIINISAVYKINLPNGLEIIDVVNKTFDFKNFNYISPIFNSFSFNSEKYKYNVLSEYVEKYNIDSKKLYFYEECKKEKIGHLSVKRKIILLLLGNINKYNCVLFSLEGLSENTINYLTIDFSRILIDFYSNKTFIFFDFTTTKYCYEELKINLLSKEL